MKNGLPNQIELTKVKNTLQSLFDRTAEVYVQTQNSTVEAATKEAYNEILTAQFAVERVQNVLLALQQELEASK